MWWAAERSAQGTCRRSPFPTRICEHTASLAVGQQRIRVFRTFIRATTHPLASKRGFRAQPQCTTRRRLQRLCRRGCLRTSPMAMFEGEQLPAGASPNIAISIRHSARDVRNTSLPCRCITLRSSTPRKFTRSIVQRLDVRSPSSQFATGRATNKRRHANDEMSIGRFLMGGVDDSLDSLNMLLCAYKRLRVASILCDAMRRS